MSVIGFSKSESQTCCNGINNDNSNISNGFKQSTQSTMIMHKNLSKQSTKSNINGNYLIELSPKKAMEMDMSLSDTLSRKHMNFDLEDNHIKHDSKTNQNNILSHSNSNALSQANLIVSSMISLIYILHTVYWEYTKYHHTLSHSYQNLELSLAVSLLNLLPSITLIMDVYSPFLSVAVLIHVLWVTYHTITLWAVELCYQSIDDGCNAIMLYKNVSVSFQAVIVAHQILLMLTGCYRNKMKLNNEKINSILFKASQLHITSDKVSQLHSRLGRQQNNNNNKYDNAQISLDSLQAIEEQRICDELRKVHIGIETGSLTFDKLSESAAEEIEINEIIQRNIKRVKLQSELFHCSENTRKKGKRKMFKRLKSAPHSSIVRNERLLPFKFINNIDINEIHDQVVDSDCIQYSDMDYSENDQSTFEMYGVGTPKDTHGIHLQNTFQLHIIHSPKIKPIARVIPLNSKMFHASNG